MEPWSSLRGTRQPANSTCREPDQSSPHPVSSRSILITFSHVRQALQSSFLPSGFPIKILYSFPFCMVCAICPTHQSPWSDHPYNTCRRVKNHRSHHHVVFSSLLLRSQLRSKPHAILERPQHTHIHLKDHIQHPCKTMGKTTFSVCFVFTFLEKKTGKMKDFGPEGLWCYSALLSSCGPGQLSRYTKSLRDVCPELNPGVGTIFHTRPDWTWDPLGLLHNGYRFFPRGKAAGVWRGPPTPI
jgi:hypothetical protein